MTAGEEIKAGDMYYIDCFGKVHRYSSQQTNPKTLPKALAITATVSFNDALDMLSSLRERYLKDQEEMLRDYEKVIFGTKEGDLKMLGPVKECTCGSSSVGSEKHSEWCDKNN